MVYRRKSKRYAKRRFSRKRAGGFKRKRLRRSTARSGSASGGRYARYRAASNVFSRAGNAAGMAAAAAAASGAGAGFAGPLGLGATALKGLSSILGSTGGSPIKSLQRVQSMRVQQRARAAIRASQAFRQKVMSSYYMPRRVRSRATGGINGTTANKRYWYTDLTLGAVELYNIRRAVVAESVGPGTGAELELARKMRLLTYREDFTIINTQATRVDVWYYMVRPRRVYSTTDIDATSASPADVMNSSSIRDRGLVSDSSASTSSVGSGDPQFSPYQSESFRRHFRIVKAVKFSLMPGSEQKVIYEIPSARSYSSLDYPDDTLTTGSKTVPGFSVWHLFGFVGQHVFDLTDSGKVGLSIPRLNFVKETICTAQPVAVASPTDEIYGAGYDTILAANMVTQTDDSSVLSKVGTAASAASGPYALKASG